MKNRNQKGQFIKGITPWNTGKKGLKIGTKKGAKFSKEHRLNLSKSHKGQVNVMKGTGAHTICTQCGKEFYHWRQGEKRHRKFCSKRCQWFFMQGDNHWNWKGGISPLAEKIRKSFKYRQWRSDIFTRDDYTCQECHIKGGKLHAHHTKLLSYIIEEYKIKTIEDAVNCEELWNINNGITFCEKCHFTMGRHKL